MDEEKKETTYEDLGDSVDHFSGEAEHDLLTDPEAMAEDTHRIERERALDHGARLRASREERGFTIEELAARAGVEPHLLAQVEAGEDFLPLGQLIRVTKALSLKMADVISTGPATFTIVRSNERQTFSRFGAAKETSHGYEYESLAGGKSDRRMEPFIVTLHPAASDEPSTHDGEEFIYVLEGEMEVIIEGARDVLRPGDAIYYDATASHLVRAYGDRPARILAVLMS